MSDVKLSYSGWTTYHMCPKKWELHYRERLRTTKDSSPLVFGIAIDEAINALLLKQTNDPVSTFKELFTWERCTNVKWLKSDLDTDLFTEEQKASLTGQSEEYATWACMRIKGRLMIEAYIRDVLPRIKEVHDVQLQTRPRPGVIDAVLSIDGDTKYIVDHKTTSRPYERDSVVVSNQLALYARATGISEAAYITLVKMPRKNKRKVCRKCGNDGSTTSHKTCNNLVDAIRCHGDFDISVAPVGVCQVIKGVIPKETQDLADSSVSETEKAIANNVFPKNLTACDKMFGAKCIYYNYCRNGSMNGLTKKGENDGR